MRFVVFTLSLALWVAVPAVAITPYRVADINLVPDGVGSNPTGFASIGGRMIFGVNIGKVWSTDGSSGGTLQIAEGFRATAVANSGTVIYFSTVDKVEDSGTPFGPGRLWVTDGTPAGTAPIVSDFQNYSRFAAVPGTKRLFFERYDDIHGDELWTSDGTVAGTHMVIDLRPGPEGGFPRSGSELTVLHGKVYFAGNDGRGPALWVSDGTASGTERIYPFVESVEIELGPHFFFALADRFMFLANTSSSGFELWTTDGTAAGTVQLTEIPGGAPAILTLRQPHISGSLAYFVAIGDSSVFQVWRTDGTTTGTFPLTDFAFGEPFGPLLNPRFATVGSRVVFLADDSSHGFEPWMTDGTVAGTQLIKDVCPGFCSGASGAFGVEGERFYFGNAGELWVSNLTAAGTRRLKDLCVGHCTSNPQEFVTAGGFVYLRAHDAGNRSQLWRTDGSTPGTIRLTDNSDFEAFRSGHLIGAALGGALLFTASDPLHGSELWRSDGSRAGTRLLADLEDRDLGGSYPHRFMKAGTKSFFFADDGVHGFELWMSDGTSGGTRFVRELVPGPGPTQGLAGPGAGWDVKGRLVFFSYGRLWVSDGTEQGTIRLHGDAVVATGSVRMVGQRLFFFARDAAHGIEPWVTDGTRNGTRLLRDTRPGPLSGSESRIFVLKGRLLFGDLDSSEGLGWLSDGTPAGTVPLKSVYPFLVEPLSRLSSEPVEVGGKIYFDRRCNGSEGSCLWVTDLTAAGTREIGPIRTEPGFFTQALFAVGAKIFVFGSSSEGQSLWVTDGRPGGARKLGPAPFLFPETAQPTAFGGRLYFPGPEQPERYLWVSDGTVAGTRPVRDAAGTPLVGPATLALFGGVSISSNRLDIWSIDGTVAGTVRLIERGVYGDPQGLVVAGSRLYFAERDDEAGAELWALRP